MFRLLSLALMACMTAEAATYTLAVSPKTLDDWKSRTSYVEDSAPAGDGTEVVVIPDGGSVLVDDASVAFVSSLGRLSPGVGSVITFDLANDAEIACAVTASGETRLSQGMLVKKGAGKLKFKSLMKVPFQKNGKVSTSAQWDYDVNVKVEEGAVELIPQTGDVNTFYYGDVDLDEGTLLILGAGSSDPGCANYTLALTGSGTVTNGVGSASRCRLHPFAVSETPAVFSGRIVDKVYVYSGGNQHYTATDSTFAGGLRIYNNAGRLDEGIAGVAKIGEANEPSSIGTSGTITLGEAGSRFLYLGTGETTTKLFMVNENKDGAGFPCVVDAGATGNLTLNGQFRAGLTGYNQRLVLTGSNTQECVFNGALTIYNASRIYVTKSGTGTWRFADSANSIYRAGISGIAVKEGVLAFDSLGERNETSSLGEGAMFLEDVWGEISGMSEVPYQFKMGGDSTEGTLRYVGSKTLVNRTRPMVLAGDARLVNAGSNDGSFYAAGVSSLNARTNTLTLAGSHEDENQVRYVSDGAGRVRVVKEGAGTWILGGTNSFTGGLDVKAGKLVLRSPGGKFTWFRWTIRELNSGAATIAAVQFCLFDAEGNRVNGGLTRRFASNVLDAGSLMRIRPGEIAYGKKIANWNDDGGKRNAENLFNDSTGPAYNFKQMAGDGSAINLIEGDESTHIPLVMRLDPAAAEVASYDVVLRYANNAEGPKSWKLEGSADGETWYQLHEKSDVPVPSANFPWVFAGGNYTAGDIAKNKYTNGQKIAGSTNEVVAVYDAPVSVAAGAVLEGEGVVTLKALAVDGTTAGTIRNVAFGEAGTIDLPKGDLAADGAVLPFTFENVTGTENFPSWTVRVGGRVSRARKVVMRDGRLCVEVDGLLMMIR